MASVAPNRDDSIWRRRLTKRLAGVRSVKTSLEYAASSVRPPTPDPSDRTVSKRRWQRSVQEFRRALRDLVPQQPVELLETPDALAPPVHSFLEGSWEDQRGSIYKLVPGRADSFHVETTRPCGQTRFTRDLVRVTMVRGCEKTIWGHCRYELERRGPNELFWRGPAANDIFSWRRL